MRINLFQKPTEKCPRCLGKGFVDNSDIERLNKELEWELENVHIALEKEK